MFGCVREGILQVGGVKHKEFAPTENPPILLAMLLQKDSKRRWLWESGINWPPYLSEFLFLFFRCVDRKYSCFHKILQKKVKKWYLTTRSCLFFFLFFSFLFFFFFPQCSHLGKNINTHESTYQTVTNEGLVYKQKVVHTCCQLLELVT